MESVRRTHVALKGPMATAVAQGPPSINVALRKELDLYANLRPVRNVAGVSSRWSGVDLVIVRENTEDLYAGLEHTVVPGVVESLKIITEHASTRIARFAFEYARKNGRKKIHAIHKANIMKLSDGLFLEFDSRGGREISRDRISRTDRGQRVHATGDESGAVRCSAAAESLWGRGQRSCGRACGRTGRRSERKYWR